MVIQNHFKNYILAHQKRLSIGKNYFEIIVTAGKMVTISVKKDLEQMRSTAL